MFVMIYLYSMQLPGIVQDLDIIFGKENMGRFVSSLSNIIVVYNQSVDAYLEANRALFNVVCAIQTLLLFTGKFVISWAFVLIKTLSLLVDFIRVLCTHWISG